jgi:SPP1 gp7 family putative phage head morphogenesis protein
MPKIDAIDLSGWQDLIEKIAKKMHDGELKPQQLDRDMILETYKELSEAAGKGYGSNWAKFGDDAGSDTAVMELKRNLFRFSGAKTYAQLEELNDKLLNGSKKATWEDFKAEALKLNDKYNINHLQAEFQTARQASSHARNWQEFQKKKRLFPNLKYRTAGDDRVREDHKSLDGIIAPIDSDFWKKYYPPNGWRCRCGVTQTAETVSKDIPTNVPSIKPEFQSNIGLSNQVFNEGNRTGEKPHPYFSLSKQKQSEALKRSFELSKVYAPFDELKMSNGSKVKISPFADINDLQINLEAAKKIAENLKIDVTISAHLNTKIVPGKNPEYLINGLVSDLKTPKNYSGISNGFSHAKKQNVNSIVIDFTKNFENLDVELIFRILNGKYKGGMERSIRECFLIYKNKVVKITAKDFVDSNVALNLIKKLKA